MEKTVIILDGVSIGKTKFCDTAKANEYWIWNINHRNVLSMLAHKIGWDGNRNRKFHDFISEFVEMANRFWNFEEYYCGNMLEKFERNERATLLVVHSCSKPLRLKMQEKVNNCFGIMIAEEGEKESTYDITLNCNAENFEEEILETLDVLSKNERSE